MTTAAAPKTQVNIKDLAAAWREARRLYPIYAAVIGQFDLGIQANKDLESPINRAEPAAIGRIQRWFESVDAKCEVWQLRQVLQTSAWVSKEQLRSLATHHLAIKTRDARLRDKVDYLLVQYYAHCSPEDAHNRDLTFEHVGECISELVGAVGSAPAFSGDINTLLVDLNKCGSLEDLLNGNIIARARGIKEKLGDAYFTPEALTAFARFNFLLRVGFFRLMHADLHAIRFALHAMEERGQSACDCRSAGLAASEPITHLREICHDWKKPFRAAYSSTNFQQIIAVRKAVEAAVKAPAPVRAPEAPKPAPALEAAPVATSKVEVPAGAPQFSIEGCIEQIAERLLHTSIKNASVTNLMFGELKVMLASWEVSAFTRGGDPTSDVLQRAVAARVALNMAMHAKQSNAMIDIRPTLAAAHAEAAQMQERIAEAKEKKDIDAAVNLAASSKRLLSLTAEAEKLA